MLFHHNSKAQQNIHCVSENGNKYYICVIDNLLLLPTVKELSKSLNSWRSYCKRFDTTFFPRHSVHIYSGENRDSPSSNNTKHMKLQKEMFWEDKQEVERQSRYSPSSRCNDVIVCMLCCNCFNAGFTVFTCKQYKNESMNPSIHQSINNQSINQAYVKPTTQQLTKHGKKSRRNGSYNVR